MRLWGHCRRPVRIASRGNVFLLALGMGALLIAGCGTETPAGPVASSAPATQARSLPEPAPLRPAPQQLPLPRTRNGLGMELVELPGGSFQMGAPESDQWANADEKPRHLEHLDRPVHFAVHEVTVGHFKRFTEATGYRTSAERLGVGYRYNAATLRLEPDSKGTWRNTGFSQDDSHPVVNVTWDDAQAFCQWLSDVEQVEYRLPSEIEWEYACRAGTETPWFCGDTEDSLIGAANICDASLNAAYPFARWSMDWNDGFAFTAPVGSFPPNAFGLCDLHGNVFEWCSDQWTGHDYAGEVVPDETVTDLENVRVLRGGSYLSLMLFTRSSDRVGLKSSQCNAITGFRVVHN